MIDQHAEIERMLHEGMAAARSGQKGQAQSLLRRVVQLDSRNEQGWLWLSGVEETNERRIEALERVLRINPTNAAAQRGLAHLRAQASVSEAAAPAATGATIALDQAGAATATAAEASPPQADVSPILDELRMLTTQNRRKGVRFRWSEVIILIVVIFGGLLLVRFILDRTFPPPNRGGEQAQVEQPVEEQPVEEQPVEEPPVEEPPVEEPPVEEPPVEEPPVTSSGVGGSFSSSSYTLIIQNAQSTGSEIVVDVTLQNPTFGNLRFHGGDFRVVDGTGAELPLDASQSSLVRGNNETYRSIAGQDQVSGNLIFSGGGQGPFQLIWTPSDAAENLTIDLGI